MRSARNLLVALALLGAPTIGLLPTVAHAQDALAGGGMITMLPLGDVIADGNRSVDLYVVAIDGEGKGLKGLKVKTSATSGTVSGLSEAGDGLYKVTFKPEAVMEPTTVTISLRGKTAERDAVNVAMGVNVRPAMGTDLATSANPERVVLGSGTRATIAVEATGHVQGAEIVARSNAGTVEPAVSLGGGKFTASFAPDPVNYPHLALIGLADRRNPAEARSFVVVPLDGKTEFPVTSKPNAQVLMRIGDGEFGPVQTDAAGKARVPIVVPPGAGSATLVTIENGSSTESEIDLRIPETRRMVILPTASSFVGEAGKTYPIHVAVATPAGEPDAGASVKLKASKGKVSAVRHLADGIYAANYTPGTVGERTIVTLSAQVGDSPTQVDSLDVTLVPAIPAQVTMKLPEGTAARSTFDVELMVADGSGKGMDGRDLVVEVLGGRLAGPVTDNGDGSYVATVEGASDRVEVFAMARGASSGNALAHVLVMPASSSLPGDGETRTGVTIVTVDRDGHPVGGVPVGLQVEGADGSIPASVTTGEHGYARVNFTAGRVSGVSAIRANASGIVGTASVMQGGTAMDLPSTMGVEARAVQDAWRARMASAVLGEDGAATASVAPPPVTKDSEPEPEEEAEETAEEPAAEPAPEAARDAAPADAEVSALSISGNVDAVAPGGSVTLTISALDGSDRGVEGHSFELITKDGKLGSLEEIGAGDYRVTFRVSKKAADAVRVSVVSEDGPASFIKIAVSDDAPAAEPETTTAETAEKPEKEPKERAPKTASGDGASDPTLRVYGAFALSSYYYQQEPGNTNTVLLPDRFSVGASAGPNATSLGADVGARLWASDYFGVDARVRATFHGVTADVFGGAVAPDTLMLVEAHGLARYPFQAGSSQFHVGARLGVGMADFIYYTGSVDSGTVEYSNFLVPELDVGAEIGALVGPLGIVAGFTEGLAYGTVPSRTAIDLDLTLDVADPLFLQGGFGVQTRRLPVIGNNTGTEQGVLTDGQLMVTVGAGLRF